MQIAVEGLDTLFVGLDRFGADVIKEAGEGLHNAGEEIIKDAKNRLRDNKSIATGFLRSSGKVQKVPTGYDVGFSAEYAQYVEYGTKAHWMSYRALWSWVAKKYNLPDVKNNPEIHRIAYFISRKIKAIGTKPHPFFNPAVKSQERNIENEVSKAIQVVLTKYKNN